MTQCYSVSSTVASVVGLKVEEAAKGLGRHRRKESHGKASCRMCEGLYFVCGSVWNFDV